MKKLFLLFATAGLLLASCSNDDNDNARRLPSQITMMSLNEFGQPDHWYIEFAYDDQNRLIRMVNRGEGGSFADTLHFFYETGNSPVRAEGTGNRTMEFQHVDNQIIIEQSDDWEEWTTTLTLNANMQIVSSFGGTFEYDANGSLISIDWGNPDDGILTFTHTNIRSIFRYANMPNWMTSWMLDAGLYPTLGYMPASISRNGTPVATMTHNLDGGSGFIRTRTITWHGEGFVETQTFDYINAR